MRMGVSGCFGLGFCGANRLPPRSTSGRNPYPGILQRPKFGTTTFACGTGPTWSASLLMPLINIRPAVLRVKNVRRVSHRKKGSPTSSYLHGAKGPFFDPSYADHCLQPQFFQHRRQWCSDRKQVCPTMRMNKPKLIGHADSSPTSPGTRCYSPGLWARRRLWDKSGSPQ